MVISVDRILETIGAPADPVNVALIKTSCDNTARDVAGLKCDRRVYASFERQAAMLPLWERPADG